jgi:hypothetical protein
MCKQDVLWAFGTCKIIVGITRKKKKIVGIAISYS